MKKIITREIQENIDLLHPHPLLHKIYAARGVKGAGELDYDLTNLLSYKLLKDVDSAVECLAYALKEQQNVVIIGDFDADGATSTTLAVLALKSFGLKNVSYLIPSRFDFGYGLTPEIVNLAAKRNPQLIITVDNGITSIEGVKAANSLGIKVLITDHHLPGIELPPAVAIVNPNQESDQFLSKNLAGVGVIFYLMVALRTHLRAISWFELQNIPMPNMAQFLDLVALGTVADVVSLDYNNRILVEQGLKRIRSGQCRASIKELLAITKRSYETTLAGDLGFVVGPRLNAVGRLDDMSIGVECLLSEDTVHARMMAKKLDQLNQERRSIEEEMQQQAFKILDKLKLTQDLPPGICVFAPDWHQGVLGILASRLKDKLQRPVIAFATGIENEIKGSARSIPGVNIRNVLNNIALKQPSLMNRFGGHAMAAGLSLPSKNYPEFCAEFAKEVKAHMQLPEGHSIVYTDGNLPVEYLDIKTAQLLREASPWGQDFPEPVFCDDFILVDQRLIGQKHLRLTLRLIPSKESSLRALPAKQSIEDSWIATPHKQHEARNDDEQEEKEVEAIWFNINPNIWPNFRVAQAKFVYRLGVNEYNGRRNLQLMINEVIHE